VRPNSFTLLWKYAAFALGAVIAFGSVSGRAKAQAGSSNGTLFLLFPVGAETVGVGEAAVALRFGTESVWSNPSAIARDQKREAAIHHSETIGARGDVITVVVPNKSLLICSTSVTSRLPMRAERRLDSCCHATS